PQPAPGNDDRNQSRSHNATEKDRDEQKSKVPFNLLITRAVLCQLDCVEIVPGMLTEGHQGEEVTVTAIILTRAYGFHRFSRNRKNLCRNQPIHIRCRCNGMAL